MKIHSKFLIIPVIILTIVSPFSQITQGKENTISEELSYRIFDMPFEFAGTESHAGPATLAMLFKHYGCSVNQEEFMNISSTNAPGVRGTPIEGYLRALNYDNYTEKDFGYEGKLVNLENYSSEARWDFLKAYVDEEIPVVILTRCCVSTNYYIAYRLLTGYDERTKSLYCNDPFRGSDESTGPLSDFRFTEFEHRWGNIGYQLIIPKMMEVTMEIETKPIGANTLFTLKSNINCENLPEIPENLSLELSLPVGYSQQGNNVSTVLTNNQPEITYELSIMSSDDLSLEDTISLKVTYLKENKTYGNIATIHPVEPVEPIISRLEVHSDLVDDFVPDTFDVQGQVEFPVDLPYNINIDSYNYSVFNVYPTYQYYSLNLAMNQTKVAGTLGEFEHNETIIFTWVIVNISQTRFFKSPISIFIINKDLDSSKYKLPEQVSFFGIVGGLVSLMGLIIWRKAILRKMKGR